MSKNVNIITYNIVLKKKDLNSHLIGLDEIKNELTNVTKDPEPIVSQFPGLIVFGAPMSQLAIVVQNDMIVITDSSTELSSANCKLLSTLAHAINDKIPNELLLYALNYDYNFTLSKKPSSAKLNPLINLAELKTAGLLSSNAKTKFNAVNLEEDITGGTTRTSVSVVFNKEGRFSNKLQYRKNLQFNSKKLPDITKLSSDILKQGKEIDATYTKLQAYLG